MRQLITENNAILLDVFKRYMANNIESMLHISALEQNKASDKLLRILQWLSIGHGVEIKPGIFKINIRLTHQDLAQMTGITRETVAVEIGKLRKLKIVNYHAQHYVLDVDRMRKLAGEDELRQVKL